MGFGHVLDGDAGDLRLCYGVHERHADMSSSWGDSSYYRDACGGYLFSESIDNAVSMNFTGK